MPAQPAAFYGTCIATKPPKSFDPKQLQAFDGDALWKSVKMLLLFILFLVFLTMLFTAKFKWPTTCTKVWLTL